MNDSIQAMVDFLRERYRTNVHTHERLFSACSNGRIGADMGVTMETRTRQGHGRGSVKAVEAT
ncbi:hypothetical protein [Kitasatospora sp. NPDC006786]|uniref:hypothetical protein n=1 Tax=unclassified Kitasatospora TaxID=2633591 RepID=UPI0033CCBB5F